jgi:hypothetical protein
MADDLDRHRDRRSRICCAHARYGSGAPRVTCDQGRAGDPGRKEQR